MLRESIRLLIVEDEAIIAIQLKRKLEQKGYKVFPPTHDGQTAIDSAIHNNPDFILMDIRLRGDINGIEAVRIIHEKSPIPVAFITGYKSSEIEEQALSVKPKAILGKPVMIEELDSLIFNSFS